MAQWFAYLLPVPAARVQFPPLNVVEINQWSDDTSERIHPNQSNAEDTPDDESITDMEETTTIKLNGRNRELSNN